MRKNQFLFMFIIDAFGGGFKSPSLSCKLLRNGGNGISGEKKVNTNTQQRAESIEKRKLSIACFFYLLLPSKAVSKIKAAKK